MSLLRDNKRASLILIYDIEAQTFLSVFKNTKSYDIPGGKCFNNELYEDCAIRELEEETGLIVKKKDLKLLHFEKCDSFNIKTFIVYDYYGNIETEEEHHVSFVPIKNLLINENKNWLKYHLKILKKLKQI